MLVNNREIQQRYRENGAVLPLVTIALVGLLSFIALAIDLGLMMVARNQCQNAADIAALAGTRALTGDPTTNYNQANAPSYAYTAAEQNSVLGSAITAGQVTLSIGQYYYDYGTSRFVAYPSDPGSMPSPTDPPSSVTATVISPS